MARPKKKKDKVDPIHVEEGEDQAPLESSNDIEKTEVLKNDYEKHPKFDKFKNIGVN